MRKQFFILFLLTACFFIGAGSYSQGVMTTGNTGKWALAIHGGAGGPERGKMAPGREKMYTDRLANVLKKGSAMLQEGKAAIDVVEACVVMMEDDSLFNAGKGAVFTAEGKNEMDAAIMDGNTMKAGAVAGVTVVKNPVKAARAVMDKSGHVMLTGEGAEIFAKKQGLEIVDPSYFYTKERWDALQRIKEQEKNKDHGTVGAVALDVNGNLAAATSTGGMTNKMKGRIGDSPIIGAGTYANNNTCAVSATGHGEYFIRNVVAYDLSAKMEYQKMQLNDAARQIVMEKLKNQGADGGLIAVDRDGNISMPFNSNAMFRGSASWNSNPEVFIW